MIELRGIAIRSGSRKPMRELQRARLTPQMGLEGDYRGKPGPRQLTLLSGEAWTRACDELGVVLPWTTRRANLLISGREFGPEDMGRTVHIGSVRLRINIETDPCFRMDEQHPGLLEALTPAWRGGVCCSVMQGGRIAVGDVMTIA